MKKTILLGSVLLLLACQGWRPLYQQNGSSYDSKISKINIHSTENVERNIEGQHLYNALLDRQINSSGGVKNYELLFTLDRQQTNQAILGDDNAAIVRLHYRVDYTLDNGQQQHHFQSQTSTTYAADYGPLQNEILADHTAQLTMETLAEMMLRRIASFLLENPEW